MNEFIGAAAGDRHHILGKFLYFSLTNLLVDKDELSYLCESMGIPYSGSNRLSVSDAFRSATGDIRERIPVTEDGETNIYLAYCRDNKHTHGVLSRELVKETLNRQTNQYEKLANISYDKADTFFAATIWSTILRWMCLRAAGMQKNFLNSISAVPTASRSKQSASITCALLRPPS